MSRIYVALDLETTGLSATRDAIIEIGVVKFRDDEVLETWTTLVNPGRPLPYRIQRLTGITDDDLRDAPELFSVLGHLTRIVGHHPIVGHNVAFDLGFLNRQGLFLSNPPVDTFELASILMPYASRYNLGTLADSLGIELSDAHRALDDALATKDLFLALFDRARQLNLNVIQEINRLAADNDWPLRFIFQDAERARARTAFAGSIAQQLAAKGAAKGAWEEDVLLGLLSHSGEKEEALRPSRHPQPLDVEALSAMLEEGGLIARSFAGYEHRPQQVRMLRAVAEAFNRGDHLLIEAGTGTGKSLAYLLPAITYAVTNGRRVVVSTNTINLQDQLYHKDLPDLAGILPHDFRATVLKGRSNYLCRRRFDMLRRRQDLTADEVRVMAKILAWMPSTTTGDYAELTLINEERAVWSQVRAEAESCRPETCTYSWGDRCFFYRARQRAESAHIIAVNHALLLSDIAVDNRVLPDYDHLIVDEAHHLEDRATDQLGFSLERGQLIASLAGLSQSHGPGNYTGFLADLSSHLGRSDVPRAIQREAQNFIEELHGRADRCHQVLYRFLNTLESFLEAYKKRGGAYDQRIRLTSGLRVQPAWAEVEIACQDFTLTLTNLHRGLEQLYKNLADLDSGYADEIPEYEDLLSELGGYVLRVAELKGQLNTIVSEPSANGIYWAQIRASDERVSLHAAPLYVGDLLNQHLFSAKETVVLTSATLQTAGSFHHIRERLGLQGVREETVGSPFDYASSTLLYLPTDIPEPGQTYYQKTVERTLVDLSQAMQGRTLVLFTSYSQLRATYNAISRPLGESDIAVLAQGLDGSRRHLLETFKEGDRTVLLGTRSFWEGIDVMGEALSCLVIARLPFDVPSDPVFAARCETFDDPFGQYAVPQTILRFRQGFGRLIRSKTDRGVVVVLDKRLLTKSYGSAFLASLPPCTIRRASVQNLPEAAVQWVDNTMVYQTGLGI